MAILRILTEEEETLRKKSRRVEQITPRILTLLDDMLVTMHHANGVGLAAAQVGVLRRVIVIEVEEDDVIELINPEIVAREGVQEGMEGCLSLPGQCGITKRPMTVTVKATDRKGKEFTRSGTGLLAKAFCHEIDHLDGKLYKDIALRMLTDEEREELEKEEQD